MLEVDGESSGNSIADKDKMIEKAARRASIV